MSHPQFTNPEENYRNTILPVFRKGSNEDKPPLPNRVRRGLAYMLDITILGMMNLGLYLWLEHKMDMGDMLSWWFAPVLFMLYFGVGNSKLTGGRTFGKYATEIKLVDAVGDFLPVGTSMMRSLIPCFLLVIFGSIQVMGDVWQPFYTPLLELLVILLFLVAIFNAKTGQTLHDLVLNTYIVRQDFTRPEQPFERPEFDKMLHAGPLALLTLLVFGSYLSSSLSKPGIDDLKAIRTELLADERVASVKFKASLQDVEAPEAAEGEEPGQVPFQEVNLVILLEEAPEDRSKVAEELFAKIEAQTKRLDFESVLNMTLANHRNSGLFALDDQMNFKFEGGSLSETQSVLNWSVGWLNYHAEKEDIVWGIGKVSLWKRSYNENIEDFMKKFKKD